MCETRFYICEKCGNVIGMINSSGVPVMCCGQKMTKLEAGTVEASREKHIPVAEVNGNVVKVTVGSVIHPMTAEHNISWVYLLTDKGGQRKCLETDKDPVITFALADEKPLAVYAYCNLHGLWMTDL
ncbi:MAG: desulfoferrodoxin [Ruminococcaceae bacterium]|nr:desulfoferrodoxin [Oscillospiraceae bacterium]